MTPNETIISLAKSYGFDGAEYERDWNGFHVFAPTLNDPDADMCIGEPVVILYDGKDTRVAITEEWQEYFAYVRTLKI